MSAEDAHMETWRYIGRRWSGKKVLHAFLDEFGAELLYGKVKATAVGATYLVKVERADDNVTVYGEARFLEGPEPDLPGLEEWRLEDRAAEATRVRLQAQRKASEDNTDIGALTLRDVRRMMTGPRAPGVLAMVLRYLGAT